MLRISILLLCFVWAIASFAQTNSYLDSRVSNTNETSDEELERGIRDMEIERMSKRRVELIREISMELSDEEISDSIQLLLSNIRNLKTINYNNNEGRAFYETNRKNVYATCRQIVRLAIREHIDMYDEYVDILSEMRDVLWNYPKDTTLALAIGIEIGRLRKESYELGDFFSSTTNQLLKKYKNSRVGLLNIVYPTAFLFGRYNTAAYVLGELGEAYYNIKDYETAYFYFDKAVNWYDPNMYDLDASSNKMLYTLRCKECKEKIKEENSGASLYQFSSYHTDLSTQAQLARKYFEPIMNNYKFEDVLSGTFFRELGIDYYNANEFDYASLYFKKAIDAFQKNIPYLKTTNEQSLLSNTYNLLGRSYARIGNYEEAIKAYNGGLSCEYLRSLENATLGSELNMLLELSELYLNQGKVMSASKLLSEYDEAISSEDKRMYFDYTPDVGVIVENKMQLMGLYFEMIYVLKAKRCLYQKDYDGAVSHLLPTIQDLSTLALDKSRLYYNCLLLLAKAYMELGNLEEARSALNVILTTKDSDIELSFMAEAYIDMGKCEKLQNNPEKQLLAYEKAFGIIKEHAVSLLLTMTETERTNFWAQVSPVISEIVKECAQAYNVKNPDFAGMILDCMLLSKGILLQSSNSIKNIIINSSDNDLMTRYMALLELKNSSPTSEEFSNVDVSSIQSIFESLRKSDDNLNANTIQKLELDLLHSPRIKDEISKWQNSAFPSWKDVQKVLKSDDVAIEFFDYENLFEEHSLKMSDVQYSAILLFSNGKPQLVDLTTEKHLDYDYMTPTSALYDIVWAPITPLLTKVKNVYFSPTNKLYTIPIEFLISPKGESLSNDFNVYRLSSLKELSASKKKQSDHIKATLYGDINYSANALAICEENLKRNVPMEAKSASDFSSRMGVGSLPNTKYEVEEIDQMLRSKSVESNLVMGKDASEEYFKHMSSSDIQILHLATHGQYWAKTDTSDSNQLSFLKSSQRLSKEDEMLNRSVLYLAGANNALKDGDYIVDDGILTAREISELDFKDLALVVLSACQTGLGDITGDGVCGLQRGFKKAGANTIMMSLWKVKDEATKLLMVDFYRNLISGKTKQKSLIDAQNYLREYNGGKYSDPQYWAAFILLDAID